MGPPRAGRLPDRPRKVEAMAEDATIEDWFREDRAFPPPADFAANALVSDRSLYDEAEADVEAFWARQARELLTWSKDFTKVLEWDLPFAKWFADGELNVSYNCLDRHVEAGQGRQGGVPLGGRARRHPDDHLRRAARPRSASSPTSSRAWACEKGDRVAIYMPMIPELPVAMLACARLGAAHSVVFGGFSPDSLIDRINDAEAKVVVTADGGWRRGTASGLKVNVDAALESDPVGHRRGRRPPHRAGRRVGRRPGPLVPRPHGRRVRPTARPEPMEAEQLLYILYTSGTTAKPKGIMHTTGGYLTQVAFSHKVRLRPPPRDRRVLVRGRHRLGHRPQLHRLRAARQRGHLGHVRGHARPPPQGPACGRSSRSTASPSSTPRPPPSGPS